MHPTGVLTISYVYRGFMTHKDSFRNEDTIGNGEVQWMTAGSGIMHRKTAGGRLQGTALAESSAKDKMAPPAYRSIKNSEIVEIGQIGAN